MSGRNGWSLGTAFGTPTEAAGRNTAFQVWYPIILVAAGLFALASPTPLSILIELLVGATIAWLALVALCTGRSKFRMSRIFGTGLLVGYSSGALPSTIESIVKRNTDFTGDFGTATFALAFCQIYCGVALLWTVGELTLPYLPFPQLSAESYRRLRVFAWIGTLTVFLAFVHGDLAFMGTVSQEGEGTNIVGIFTSWLLYALVGCTADIVATTKEQQHRVIYGILLGAQLVCVFPIGRRVFLYVLLLAFTIFCHRRPRFGRSPVKVGVILAACLAFVSVAWTIFLYMRVAGYSTSGERLSAWQQAENAWHLYNSPEGIPVTQLWLQSGAEERTNIVQYNMILLTAAEQGITAHGGGALNEVKWIVPHLFWPDKQVLTEEDYASEQFGLSLTDEPNSIFSAGIVDFGFVGGIVYPLLCCWMLSFGLRACFFLPPPVPNICYYYYVCVLMSTEQELAGYYGTARDSFVWGCVLTLLFMAVARIRVFRPERMLDAAPGRFAG